MFSTERRQQSLCGVNYIGGGLGFLSYGNYRCSSEEAGFIGSEAAAVNNSILMANEESRDEREESNSREHTDQEDHERDKDWLQLSIGGPIQDPTTRKSGPGLVELALMPSSSVMRPLGPSQEFRAPWPAAMNYAAFNNPSIVSHQQLLQYTANSSSKSLFQSHNEAAANINWGFRPRVPISIAASNSSCSSSSAFSYPSALMAPSNYFSRPFNLYSELDISQSWAGLDFRVVQPPRRSHAGLWFMLQAMQNQEKEPYLPQIPKSYLRIKDGKMTIGLVMKYLVNKLNMDSESEIEIVCKGQRVLPLMTLQHVRDSIWNNNNSTKDFISLLPNSSTSDYIMVLHYGRSAQT